MRRSALLAVLVLLAAAPARKAPSDPLWSGRGPAPEDYRATEDDFAVFERGLADAAKVAPTLFPRGIVGTDAILFDTDYLYIYSRSASYPLPKFRRRAGYQVYRVPAEGRPAEHEMAICETGSGPSSVDVKRTITEDTLACAPWGTFGRIQKLRRSDYRFIEGYWASIIHEYGHQYRRKLEHDPTPEMTKIDALIEKAELPPGTERPRAADEGFAVWCELAASRVLYPEHYRRLMERARRAARGDDRDGHEAGLRAAAALIDREP